MKSWSATAASAARAASASSTSRARAAAAAAAGAASGGLRERSRRRAERGDEAGDAVISPSSRSLVAGAARRRARGIAARSAVRLSEPARGRRALPRAPEFCAGVRGARASSDVCRPPPRRHRRLAVTTASATQITKHCRRARFTRYLAARLAHSSRCPACQCTRWHATEQYLGAAAPCAALHASQTLGSNIGTLHTSHWRNGGRAAGARHPSAAALRCHAVGAQ
jgi:hypothetical protein